MIENRGFFCVTQQEEPHYLRWPGTQQSEFAFPPREFKFCLIRPENLFLHADGVLLNAVPCNSSGRLNLHDNFLQKRKGIWILTESTCVQTLHMSWLIWISRCHHSHINSGSLSTTIYAMCPRYRLLFLCFILNLGCMPSWWFCKSSLFFTLLYLYLCMRWFHERAKMVLCPLESCLLFFSL